MEIINFRLGKIEKAEKETLAKINKTKVWFSDKINKIDKSLARLIKGKK